MKHLYTHIIHTSAFLLTIIFSPFLNAQTTTIEISKTGFSLDARGELVLVGSERGDCNVSIDGGKTFTTNTVVSGNDTDHDMMAAEIVNDTLMLLSDRESSIYMSLDTGKTWTKKFNNTTNAQGRKFRYSEDLKEMLLFRNIGGVLKSTNNGQSWGQVFRFAKSAPNGGDVVSNGTLYMTYNQLQFENNKLVPYVFVISYSSTGKETVLQKVKLDNITAMDLEMYTDNIGYLFAKEGKNLVVYKTEDAWRNMEEVGRASGVNLNQTGFVAGTQMLYQLLSENTIIVSFKATSNSSASDSYILVTTDGGVNWRTVDISGPTTKPGYLGPAPKMQAIIFCDEEYYISSWELNLLATNKDGEALNITSLTDLEIDNSLSIYPNPVQNNLQFTNQNESDVYKVYGLTGELLLSGQIKEGDNSVSVKELKSGTYIVEVGAGEKKIKQLIIKQ